MYFSKAVLVILFSLSALVSAQDCSKIGNKDDRDSCYRKRGDCGKLFSPDERNDCYYKKGDCENIARKEDQLYKRCQDNRNKRQQQQQPQQPPPNNGGRPPAGQSWQERLNNCKKVGSQERDANRLNCFSGVCNSVGDPNDRDRCWDGAKADCKRRSTPEKRDICRMEGRECNSIETQRRKEDCWRKHPSTVPKGQQVPPPPPPRQTQPPPRPTQPPPRPTQPAPRPNPPPRPTSTWGPQPTQNWGNQGAPRGPPQQGWQPQQPQQSQQQSCNSDQECLDRGQCEQIRDNIKFDECVYKKRNKHCDGMREPISKDFCFSCTRQCEKISGFNNDSQDYKDACLRGQLHPAC